MSTLFGATITVNGVEYRLIEYPLHKTVAVHDIEGHELFEAVEDITGEYMEFYKESEFLDQSPHIGNFAGVQDCIEWFINVGEF